MVVVVVVLRLLALVGLAGHYRQAGQVAQVATGLGITGQGRPPRRHHHRRRRAAGARELPEHPQQRAARAVATDYPPRRVQQRRLASVGRRTLAVEHRPIWRRSNALLVDLALLENQLWSIVNAPDG